MSGQSEQCGATVNRCANAQPATQPGCSADGWCSQSAPAQGRSLSGLWGSDANSIWAVGDAGLILKWNGTSWDAQSSPATANLYSIWGSDANNVWAIG